MMHRYLTSLHVMHLRKYYLGDADRESKSNAEAATFTELEIESCGFRQGFSQLVIVKVV